MDSSFDKSRTFWKCLFKTSNNPYAKPHRKKSSVMSVSGKIVFLPVGILLVEMLSGIIPPAIFHKTHVPQLSARLQNSPARRGLYLRISAVKNVRLLTHKHKAVLIHNQLDHVQNPRTPIRVLSLSLTCELSKGNRVLHSNVERLMLL